jgi:hypothetical protein
MANGLDLPVEEAALLQWHWERGIDTANALLAGRSTTRSYKDMKAELRQIDPTMLVSVVTCFLATNVKGRQMSAVNSELELLEPRRLPYGPLDASLLLHLAAQTPGHARIKVALRAAEVAKQRASADDTSLDGALLSLLNTLEVGTADAPPYGLTFVPRVRLLLAGQPGELDVTPIATTDNFGLAMIDLARRQTDQWLALNAAIHLMAEPKGPRPNASTTAKAARVFADSDVAQRFVFDCAELLTTVELTKTTEETHGRWAPPIQLVSDANVTLATSTAWYCRFVTDPARARLLGQVALRCASANFGHMAAATLLTTPLAPKVANAAIDTLAALPDGEGAEELEGLFNEVPMAETFRRIGKILGKSESTIQDRIKETRARPKAHLPSIRRISTRPGDVGFVTVGNGKRVYLQLASRHDLGDLIRVLPGRHAPLSKEELSKLVSGPDEFLTFGLFTGTLQLHGCDKVGKFPIPDWFEHDVPYRIKTVQSPTNPEGREVKFQGQYFTSRDFAERFPHIDQAKLPSNGIPFPATLRARIERDLNDE